MTDDRRFDHSAETPAALEGDLEALRRVTERHVPALEHTWLAVRTRAARSWRERLMSVIHDSRRRPWIATAAVAVVAALALLVVPISYERTTGHEVSLTLAADQIAPQQLASMARELKALLGAGSVSVAMQQNNDSRRAVLTARVPAESGATAQMVAQAFAGTLRTRDIDAQASVKPVRERVSGTVYAYARDQVIRIDLDGKSAAELESEIRSRLAEAGIGYAEVSVEEEVGPDGKKKMKFSIGMHREHVGGAPDGEEIAPQLEFTRDGEALTGERFMIKVGKLKDQTGATTLRIDVTTGDRTATVTVPNADTMGDAAVQAEIERQLADAGIRARVSVQGEKIQIEPIP